MANATYIKLLIEALGTFLVVLVQPRILTNDKNGIPKSSSVDRATLVQTKTCQYNTSSDIEIQTRECESHFSEHATQTRADTAINSDREFTVQRIVRHVSFRKNIWSVTRRYGCRAKNKTIEPPEHIPSHFIAHYWR